MSGPDPTLEMPALGRPFQLGMLYDCFRDALLSEHSLLDPETRQENTEKTTLTSQTFQEVSSDTLEEKAAALEIPPSLLTSILCGLFEVDGAAKYFLSSKKSRYQERVTYKYLAMERVEHLMLDRLRTKGGSFHTVPKNCKASHVVTAVWYGEQSFQDYAKEVSTPENVGGEIGSPEAVLLTQGERGLKVDETGKAQSQASHPTGYHVVTAAWYGEQSFQDYAKEVSTLENVGGGIGSPEAVHLTQGERGLKVDETGKAQSQASHPTFDGRSSQEHNPVPLQDFVRIHSNLPILGWSGEKGVPVKVRLYPLMNLEHKDPEVQFRRSFHEISAVLNSNIKHEIADLIETETRSEDLLKDPTVQTFLEIRKKIQQFKDLCGQYKQAFQKQLAEIIPLVREGVKDEEDLEEVLERKRKSPFDTTGLCEFLDAREREIAFLNSLLSVLKDVEIVGPKKQLEEKVFDCRTDFVVAFLFTSLHKGEPYLAKLEAHLSPLVQVSGEMLSCPSWLEDKTVITRAREAAESFAGFVCANPSSEKTQFVVASIPDDDNPGAAICLYEKGDRRGTRFEPPSRPLPVEIGEISADSVQLRLTPGESGAEAVCCFQVEHRAVGQKNWAVEVTNGREEVATVRGLSPDTEYEFRCTAVSKPGCSESSEARGPVKTLLRSPPSTPQEADRASPVVPQENTNLRKDERNTCCVEEREVGQEEGGMKWSRQSTGQETENAGGLPAFTSVQSQDDLATAGRDPRGEPRNVARSVLRTSRKVRDGHPSVYTLALQKSICGAPTTCVKYSLGKEASRLHHKVILLLGETGAGKSTLIDSMVNYVLGVRWEDGFRFKVVQDVPKRSQAVSQTETLTAYEVNLSQGLRVPYSLTLIDTPGFGDTRGTQHDKMLQEQIRAFFSSKQGFGHIDAVCVVVQASQPRLTQPQKYIFDAILSIFGKDIQENIQVLITFADGRAPPVLEAVRVSGVPCARDAKGVPVHFSFNNSTLFSSNVQQAEEDSYRFNQMFWQMGVGSLDRFFRSLGGLEPRSLTMTAEVLRERKELEAVVQGMRPQIKMALVKVDELRTTQRALARHRGDMEANRNFEYELETTVPFKIDISGMGYHITNCQQCHTTCHYPCQVENPHDKWKCAAMDKSSGRCCVCPGRCRWDIHFSQSYKWDYCVRK
ncbi:PREDICTED: uncharacterized protein LOC107123532 [Gekko japonicus]|uniref:Uncharacterized protein LOC107123532 n=1 Tax=Gekko japonicus TaxID=146911 RepID=A0ABM1L8I3_GEKJA|nr:PREDICTED: uncharacterized protein LOC107123532 [Gekko japonicus]